MQTKSKLLIPERSTLLSYCAKICNCEVVQGAGAEGGGCPPWKVDKKEKIKLNNKNVPPVAKQTEVYVVLDIIFILI